VDTAKSQRQKNKKAPWYWDKIHQQAFGNVKATITKEVTLAYPDYMQGFEVSSDSSKLERCNSSE
jgi:hypothetical protein